MYTQTNAPRYALDTCALLAEFNASCWTARKLDKTTTEEVVTSKNAKAKGAARVNKHLLAGRDELDVVSQMIGRARTYVYDNTLPWSDSGLRLLPTANFIKFTEKMNAFEEEFERLVAEFIAVYPTLITAQAMALGDMFKREDFPTQGELPSKFAFRLNYMPVPVAGDFRVDVGNDAQKELREQLEKLANERVEAAMGDIRKRLGEHLTRMSDRLTTDYVAGEARQRRFHDSLVEGALELCDMTKALNITGDTTLETARKGLEMLLVGVTPDELRKNEHVRQEAKKGVDSLLDAFNW